MITIDGLGVVKLSHVHRQLGSDLIVLFSLALATQQLKSISHRPFKNKKGTPLTFYMAIPCHTIESVDNLLGTFMH